MYELRIVANVSGEYAENVLNFQNLTAGTSNPIVDAADLVAGWQANIETAWLDALSSDYKLMGYYCRQILPSVSAAYQQPEAALPGTYSAGLTTSGQGPVILSSYENYAGKFKTGKIFLAGCPNGGVADNIIVPEYLANLATLCGLLNAAFGTSPYSWQYCIYEKTAPGYAWDPQLIQPGYIIGTQRARMRPGGRGHRRH